MKIKSKNMRKKSVAILAGIAIAGAVGASAASLGGLGGEDLGADTGDVASCDTNGIIVAYSTSYSPAAGEYVVDSIDLTDVNAACEGQTFDLTVLLTDPDVVTPIPPTTVAFTGPIAQVGGAQSIDTSFATTGQTVPAEHVDGLAMSISGTTVV